MTLVQPVTYDNPKNGPTELHAEGREGNPVTEKATATEQTVPLGPVASQIAIKRSAPTVAVSSTSIRRIPFENPTPLTSIEALSRSR